MRWVRSPAALGRPDLVVLPGSKNTRADLDWFRRSGLAGAVERSGALVVAICAGLQMAGTAISDPDGVEGPPGAAAGLGWLPVATEFGGDKVLDRPSGTASTGEAVAGYRIHHGRVRACGPGAEPWLLAGNGEVLGWRSAGVLGTTLHGLFEADGFRAALLGDVARRAGKRWAPGGVSFAAARMDRLDRIADTLEAHLDLDRLAALIAEGDRGSMRT